MKKLSIEDLDLKNKKVLMRVDFNVPIKNGKVTDDSRILASVKSIKFVLDKGASIILMSHLGRPKGKDESLSLKPVAKKLSQIINMPVQMANDCIGEKTKKMAKNLSSGQILLLENLRFHAAEEKPDSDPSFAKSLSELGEVFVNDAFGSAHRKHSSTYTITKYFPHKAAMGFLMKDEIENLNKITHNPAKPFFAIIGGAKVSSKLGVLNALIEKVDALFIGGGMAYTFLKAQNISVGKSIYENDLIEKAKNILQKCKEKNVNLYLPNDFILADKFENDAKTINIEYGKNFPEDFQGMDIGPATIKKWSDLLKKAKTIFWNGPLGVFEFENFAKGTFAIAKTISQINCTSIVGGGDSIAAINKSGLQNNFTHLSTGGGASLEYIEYGSLPGIEALSNKM